MCTTILGVPFYRFGEILVVITGLACLASIYASYIYKEKKPEECNIDEQICKWWREVTTEDNNLEDEVLYEDSDDQAGYWFPKGVE
jgi:hypothetical protein